MGRIKDYQREFVKATFGINVKYFMQLINDGHFTMNLCADTHFFNDVALPLHHITICWDIVLGYYDEWKKHKDIIKARKIENDKLKSFFSDKCGLDMSYVPFNNYQNYFFCNESDATVYDCLSDTKESLLGKGIKEIDIDLRCNVEKFNFEEVERLLLDGANPYVEIPDDDDNCFDRIGGECSFLNNELFDAIIGNTYERDLDVEIPDLIGLAAHEKMYHLLMNKAKHT